MKTKYQVRSLIICPIVSSNAEIVRDIDTQNSTKILVDSIGEGYEIFDKSILICGDNACINYILRKEANVQNI